MSALPSLFRQFLSNIRPTDSQRQDYKKGHETLRGRLRDDEDLSPIYVSDFLQGSYQRWTAVKPLGDEKSDVDIVFVTNIDKDKVGPTEAMEECEPFLDKWYEGQWKRKGRSFGIELSYVEMDLVLTASPSEAAKAAMHLQSVQEISESREDWLARFKAEWDEMEQEMLHETAEGDWKTDSLDIPDREARKWERTDPLTVTEWTTRKNARCNGHYVNVVKALKWWRLINNHEPERPKSYPLEHIVGDCCPDGVSSVAEGIVLTLDAILDSYGSHYRKGEVPSSPDRGIPENDVLHRLTFEQFSQFYEYVDDAAPIAARALALEDPVESADLWKSLFGDEFPDYDGGGNGGGDGGDRDRFTPRKGSTDVSEGRFA